MIFTIFIFAYKILTTLFSTGLAVCNMSVQSGYTSELFSLKFKNVKPKKKSQVAANIA